MKLSQWATHKLYVHVAPHTGAWIETSLRKSKIRFGWSHPTRVRGLKHHCRINKKVFTVAPHTGAWIETRAIIWWVKI